MQREVVLDTETTGLNAKGDDRLIEIGCVEIVNRVPTGKEYHCYINPQRDVPSEAEAIHGLSTDFLRDKKSFHEIADEFLAFIADDTLVIHNAPFDIGFLNAELERINYQTLTMDRVIDTLAIARRKHPGGSNNLDALCKRYKIDNSKRIKHGALMDSLLLAEVYVELLGERQAKLELAHARKVSNEFTRKNIDGNNEAMRRSKMMPSRLTLEDEKKHLDYVKTLGEDAIWLRYLSPSNS